LPPFCQNIGISVSKLALGSDSLLSEILQTLKSNIRKRKETLKTFNLFIVSFNPLENKKLARGVKVCQLLTNLRTANKKNKMENIITILILMIVLMTVVKTKE